MFILAQADTARSVGALVGYFVGQFIGILIMAVIVSAIFHVIALITKKASIRFGRVFPFAFVIILVLGVLGQILPRL